MEIQAEIASEIAALGLSAPPEGMPGDLPEAGVRGGAPAGAGVVPPPAGAASPVAGAEPRLSGHGGDKSNDSPPSPLGKPPSGRSDSSSGRRPKVGIPRYVLACEQKAWSKVVWKRDDPSKKKGFCFECKSWRCQASCAAGALWRDWLRIYEGVKGKEDQAAYIVLTVETNGKDKYGHWAQMSEAWNWTLRPALMKKSRWGKFQYAQTWEQTRKGFAHVNMGIVTPKIKTWCLVEGCKHVTYRECPNKSPWCKNCGGRGRKGTLCKGWQAQKKILLAQAVRAGFGAVGLYLSPVQGAAEFSTYLNKRSGSTKGGAAEIASEITSSAAKSQLPVDAPPHFRRVRYSSLWPVPPELAKLCECGHGKHVHVRKKKDRPTACCFEGGECECRCFTKKISEYTGEIRQKPLEVVEAEIQAEEERLERVDQAKVTPLISSEIFKSESEEDHVDSSCIPDSLRLVYSDGTGSTDAGNAPVPSLRAECMADQLRERAETRTLDGHAGSREGSGQGSGLRVADMLTGQGSRLHPDVARTPDEALGPPRTPP